MHITVKLYSTLREGRFNRLTLEVKPETPVAAILRELEISEDMQLILFVNGRHAKSDTRLNEGDKLAIFPLIGGG